jgi:hypothetical protein
MDARVRPAQDQEEYGSINRSGGDPIDFERMSNSMHLKSALPPKCRYYPPFRRTRKMNDA